MMHSILGGILFTDGLSSDISCSRLLVYVTNCVSYVLLYLVLGMMARIKGNRHSSNYSQTSIGILLQIFKKWHKLLILSLSLFRNNIPLLNFTIPKHRVIANITTASNYTSS